jgi:mannose-P-dolichol utilization defect protein 1
MVALADIPFVMPLSEWVWGAINDDDVSPEICLSQVPLISMGCFSQLFTKALGIAIILGSCLNKIPIMLNITNSQSAAGISRGSLYGEVVVYANAAVYGFLEGHPFTAYGENGALLLQNVLIILMAWQFSTTKVTFQEQILVAVASVLYFILTLVILPENSRYLLQASIWPVLLYARGSQVVDTFRLKHTGNLSIVTTGLNLGGGLARIGTTLKETGDLTVLAGFVLSVGLNFIMFCQYWIYLKNTLKVSKELQEKKLKKKD